MSKKNQRESQVTINHSNAKGGNVVKIIAIILVAIMALACILAPKANEDVGSSAKAVVNIDIDGDGNTETVEVEDITRVFFVDTSGSTNNVNLANGIANSNGYDVIIPFSNFVGEEGGNSYICTCMEMALSMGVKELALYTDMECYPEKDWSAFDGKFYQNREVIIYLADNATAQNVNRFAEIAKTAFDSNSCTVKFVYTDGTEQVVFDAYGKEEVLAEMESTNGNVSVEVEATASDRSDNCNMMLFMVCMTLVIALIVISIKDGDTIIIINNGYDDHDGNDGEDDVPGGTKEVFKGKYAGLDASGSVADCFATLISGAEKLGEKEVTVFNDTVKTMMLEEAKKLSASGRTCGWTFLREAAKNGHKDIAIFSDFEFNDDDKAPKDGELEFDSITIATPEGKKCNERVIAKICTFAKKEIKKVVIQPNGNLENGEQGANTSNANMNQDCLRNK